jgi:hypothetical protein
MLDLSESERRKPGARGTLVRLADGQHWLLATPTYRACRDALTDPDVDQPLDKLFEGLVLDEPASISDIARIAWPLLKANYDLGDDEVAALLSVAPGAEGHRLASAAFEAVFGPDQAARSYGDWVRASLLANGLGSVEIPTRDLSNVLAILVATNRTIPLAQFADACREVHEQANLESLI